MIDRCEQHPSLAQAEAACAAYLTEHPGSFCSAGTEDLSLSTGQTFGGFNPGPASNRRLSSSARELLTSNSGLGPNECHAGASCGICLMEITNVRDEYLGDSINAGTAFGPSYVATETMSACPANANLATRCNVAATLGRFEACEAVRSLNFEPFSLDLNNSSLHARKRDRTGTSATRTTA